MQTNFDIVFVTETHFIKGTRFSVPQFTAHHNPLSDYSDRKPHGGISCFIRTSMLNLITSINKNIAETIVIEIFGGNTIFGNYIVPSSSPYFNDSYLSNVANRFLPKNSKRVVIGGGDLNARVGDILQKLPANCSYRKNVDEVVNDHGHAIRSICSSYNCFVLNNMNIGSVVCDGDFTFEKGGRKSQNDLVLANKYSLSAIRRFKIHDVGWNPSDHSPVSIDIDLDVTDRNIPVAASLDILYQHGANELKKPMKIQPEGIDWLKYKTLVENDYMCYDQQIQKLRNDHNLQSLDKGVNLLSDSLYKCASTLNPPRKNASSDLNVQETTDPLVELAEKTHAKWKRGECSSLERNTVRDETIDHLKKCAVAKERKAWADALGDKDSKAVWEKINWKGSFDSNTVSNKPPLVDLRDHFMSKGESTEDSTLLSDVTGNTFVPELDGEISLEEIDTATNRLKEKSSGDGWTRKMLYNLPVCLLYALQIIYNTILSTHTYPTRWRTTIVNEIFKNKGDSESAKNYRGISLVVLLSKVFDTILCTRFTKWFKPDDGQTAYQSGRAGCDHVFLLRCLVQQSKRFKQKIFIVAFDFDGAFDRVSRSVLIRKLIKFGAGVVFVACVASMYMCTDNIIFRNKDYVTFMLYSGIKQGLPLSPMLFIFYINDIFEVFRSAYGACVENIFKIIHLLVHADDLTLLATLRDDAIAKLQTLRQYCNINYIRPQTTKCKFTVINGSDSDHCPLPFGDAFLKDTDHLEILGSHIAGSGLLSDDLELHMKKRFPSCIKFFNFCHENKLAPVSVKLKTLRACVMHSLLFNCEAFGPSIPDKLETIYHKLIRTALQVRTNTPALILYIESGLLPIRALVEARQYKYYQRFDGSLKPQSERRLVFDGLQNDPSPYLKHYIKLQETYQSHNEIYQHHLRVIKDKFHEHVSKGKPKYSTYLLYNPTLEPSPFLKCMHPLTTDIIRFRVGSHCLPIETGRWTQKKREDRVCEVCGTVGDEVHYIYDCRRIPRNNLNLVRDLCEIWKQPEIFQVIGSMKSIDLL